MEIATSTTNPAHCIAFEIPEAAPGFIDFAADSFARQIGNSSDAVPGRGPVMGVPVRP